MGNDGSPEAAGLSVPGSKMKRTKPITQVPGSKMKRTKPITQVQAYPEWVRRYGYYT